MAKLTGVACSFLFCIACLLGGLVNKATADGKEGAEAGKNDLLRLVKTNSCPGCDLSELELNRMDLRGADLQGADLRNAKMHLVNLTGADLRDAQLTGAVMVGADLAGADLRGALLGPRSLDGAYIVGVLFDEKLPWQPGNDTSLVSEARSDTGDSAETDVAGFVPVLSEGDVEMVKAKSTVPSPKKLQRIQTATLEASEEETELEEAQAM